jgi:hypothetical protein
VYKAKLETRKSKWETREDRAGSRRQKAESRGRREGRGRLNGRKSGRERIGGGGRRVHTRGILYRFQNKRVTEFDCCKLLKIKGHRKRVKSEAIRK